MSHKYYYATQHHLQMIVYHIASVTNIIISRRISHIYYYITQHQLQVISSDGNQINPVTANAVIVHGGERFDFYIKTSQNGGRFWIRAETLESYNGRPYEVSVVVSYIKRQNYTILI